MDPGSEIDCKKGTSASGSSRRATRLNRTGRPSPSAPANHSVRPSVIASRSAVAVGRWTPPTRSGAAAPVITQVQAPMPESCGKIFGRRRRSRARRPLRGCRVSFRESGCGAPSLEDPFVDDEDVTGEYHNVGGAAFADVGDGKDVRLDLAAHLTPEIHRVLGGDPRESAGASDGVDDGHVGVVAHLAWFRHLAE